MKRILLAIPIIIILWLCFRTEILTGRVIDSNGNGRLYNGEPVYNYISYADVNGVRENDIVTTVCILNPLNLAEDDVVWRGDIITFRKEK